MKIFLLALIALLITLALKHISNHNDRVIKRVIMFINHYDSDLGRNEIEHMDTESLLNILERTRFCLYSTRKAIKNGKGDELKDSLNRLKSIYRIIATITAQALNQEVKGDD